MSLNINKVQEYWDQRAKAQGERTVGYSNSPNILQDKNYKIRQDFLSKYINKDLTFLDYGCGIGRHCSLFDRDLYLGAELTKDLFDFAKQREPEYSFIKLEEPFLNKDFNFNYDAIFTATVLQHNSDEAVTSIFESFRKVKRSCFSLFLYENTSNNKDASHIMFRTEEEYIKLADDVFGPHIAHECHSHTVHNEEHSIIIIDY